MKKIFLSLTVIVTFLLYSYRQQVEGSKSITVLPPSPVPVSTPSPTKSPGSSYKDGQFDGNSTDAFYGNVQIRILISGGKISDVQFLDYPKDRRTSLEINGQAMPFLRQEAIQAQNAQVDIISGATQTSLAFQKSLQSALDRAKS